MPEAASRRLDRLADAVAQTARRHRLLERGERVVCAVSGGADSVALLHVLLSMRKRLGITVDAAHVDHGIPEALSDEALALCKDMAAGLGVRLHVLRADVPALAKRRGVSLEAAGRRVRYGWFRRLLARGTASVVATAHTADDQAETVLLRLLRGAGLRGLAGIRRELRMVGPKPKSAGVESPAGGRFIRPLLDVRRAETREYIERHGLAIVEDPTNQDVSFSRNRVRHLLLPLLEERFNPAVVNALCRFAEQAHRDDEYLRDTTLHVALHVLEPRPDGWLVKLESRHVQAPIRARMWQLALERDTLGYDPADTSLLDRLDDLLLGPPGREVPLPAGGVALRTYDGVALHSERPPSSSTPPDIPLSLPGTTLDPVRGLRILATPAEADGPVPVADPRPRTHHRRGSVADEGTGQTSAGDEEHVGGEEPGKAGAGDPWVAALDADALEAAGPLRVRARQPGDRWQPAGHRSLEKLKDAFNRWRVPPAERDQVAIIVAGDHIVAIVGRGVDARFQVSSATKRTTSLEVTRLHDGEHGPHN